MLLISPDMSVGDYSTENTVVESNKIRFIHDSGMIVQLPLKAT
jgi:hypothetical protein